MVLSPFRRRQRLPSPSGRSRLQGRRSQSHGRNLRRLESAIHARDGRCFSRRDPFSNNEKLAAQAAPELQRKLASLARQLPGVELARVRPQKNPARVLSKVREGKPPDTISDYLAVEIAIDSPDAGERMVDLLRRNFKVVNVDRKMGGRENKGGYASTNVQVQMANGLTAEVQLVPREVQRASGQSHHYYVQGREARDAGNKAGARMYFKQAEKINKWALREFRERNGSE